MRKRSHDISRGLRTSNSPESPTPISKRQRLKSFTTKLRRRLSNSIYTTPEDNGSTQSLPTDFDAIFHDLPVFNEDAVSLGSVKSETSTGIIGTPIINRYIF